MPCLDETHTSTIVSLPPSLRVATERGCARKGELADERGALERGRSRPTAHLIPDSTHADPEYVWGDEGPIGD